MSVLHPCTTCGKLTPNPRCPEHERAHRSKRNARQYASRKRRGARSGTSAAYRAARAKALARDGNRCTYTTKAGRCTATRNLTTHHLNGDPNDHRPENLVTLCRRHHVEVERRARHKRFASLRIIALLGSAGVGKTTLGRELAAELEIPFASIDDFGPRGETLTRWTGLMRWLEQQHGTVMVEANYVPRALAEALSAADSLVVELRALPEVREQRLRARGETDAMVRRMLRTRGIGHRADVRTYDAGRVRHEIRRFAGQAMRAHASS